MESAFTIESFTIMEEKQGETVMRGTELGVPREMVEKQVGIEPIAGSLDTPMNKDYHVTNRIQEGKLPLYAIVFNFFDSRFYSIFATVGANRVTVYSCLEGGKIAVLQSYVDEDEDESFYTVTWGCELHRTPLLVAGGTNGVIRVINAEDAKIHKSYVGHGGAINEIKTHYVKPQLVLSASKDESVRLWNVHSGVCVLIFAGKGGHRNEVLSVDFHPFDIHRFASCGMDNTVRIWSMTDFSEHVEKSFDWTDLPSKFPTKFVQFPMFVAPIHTNYIDCIRWLGDFILSKSVENEIVLWEPVIKGDSQKSKKKKKSSAHVTKSSYNRLLKYPVPNCDIWFIKFSCDFEFKATAAGNREGSIYVWELQTCPPVLIAKLSHPLSKSPIRQTAMSFDGSTILACCEDGKIWRWDVVPSS